jgi:hypothetical protein
MASFPYVRAVITSGTRHPPGTCHTCLLKIVLSLGHKSPLLQIIFETKSYLKLERISQSRKRMANIHPLLTHWVRGLSDEALEFISVMRKMPDTADWISLSDGTLQSPSRSAQHPIGPLGLDDEMLLAHFDSFVDISQPTTVGGEPPRLLPAVSPALSDPDIVIDETLEVMEFSHFDLAFSPLDPGDRIPHRPNVFTNQRATVDSTRHTIPPNRGGFPAPAQGRPTRTWSSEDRVRKNQSSGACVRCRLLKQSVSKR